MLTVSCWHSLPTQREILFDSLQEQGAQSSCLALHEVKDWWIRNEIYYVCLPQNLILYDKSKSSTKTNMTIFLWQNVSCGTWNCVLCFGHLKAQRTIVSLAQAKLIFIFYKLTSFKKFGKNVQVKIWRRNARSFFTSCDASVQYTCLS